MALPAAGPVASAVGEEERDAGVRGLMLLALPEVIAHSGVIIVPSLAEVHAMQAVSLALGEYGSTLPGWNWGAPVKAGACKGGGTWITVPDDDCCVMDFLPRSDPTLAPGAEVQACHAFMLACVRAPGFRQAAISGDADALANACTTPPFYPFDGGLSEAISLGSFRLSANLGEQAFLAGGVTPGGKTPGKGSGPGPSPEQPSVIESMVSGSVGPGLIVGGVVFAACTGAAIILGLTARKRRARAAA